MSEPGGYFDTDNLISNESSYLHVIGGMDLHELQGGAYLGVGPETNFSYIAHQRPEMAFVLDIRRDNLWLHLYYKALFVLAPDRAQFLALHIGRKPLVHPPDSLEALMAAIEAQPRDAREEARVIRTVLETVATFGVPLDDEARQVIEEIHRQFAGEGFALRFNSHNRSPRPYYPTYRQLILGRDLDGEYAHYLARPEDYAFLREMQRQDRIVPVVGDFAGPRALRAIGVYLKEHGHILRVFYTSNVEYYLASDGRFAAFMENVRQLPIDSSSVFIRSLFNRFSFDHPQNIPGHASTQLMQRIGPTIDSYDSGSLRSYTDLVFMHGLELKP
jgi:hypothetical protein